MATTTEIVTKAFRLIGVVAEDDPATADQVATGQATLAGLVAEFGVSDTTLGTLYLPLSLLLAVDLSPEWQRPPPVPRSRAVARLRAILLPDDREDRRDTDEDGTISDDEEAAGNRALYY